ncbi:hypothetical protein ACHAW5_007999 [Stephanodiscus triporus]|uniref:Uncharacterized protein n=1 Tax=Stephanodiscus triporus TaxID=2934178 RepID=A0ABD3NDM0_9STRA
MLSKHTTSVTSRLAVALFLIMLIVCSPARNSIESLFPRAVAVASDAVRGGNNENKERVSIKKKHATMIGFNHSGIPTDHGFVGDVQGGHWVYVGDTTPPYIFSKQVCKASFINKDDCIKADYCPSNLMNWIYKDKNNNPYPRFDVDGFRRNMRNSRIIFVGSSLARQQVQALVWTLGHINVKWTKSSAKCDANRFCMLDSIGNITICHRFMGSMATKIYHEGNFTLDHSLRGHGDSSCLLHDDMIDEFDEFDLAFVQGSIAWFAGLPRCLNSSSSPFEWVERMVPELYHDAMDTYLSKVSRRTKTVFVLGQTGTSCANKSFPEPFIVDNIPHSYGWNIAPKLWNVSLTLIRENEMNVQVIDAREPLMQSVHAHPVLSPKHDCLHFCMNSSAINMYLDMYWAQVFSQYTIVRS